MREIKFRGKRVDDAKWVYGYLIKDNDNYYYIVNDCGGFRTITEVDPETVGQYTGLKDSNNNDNGKEIYEDDIINTWDKNYKVVFDGYKWALKDFYIPCLDDPCDAFSEFSGKKVGNIHNNPELLKREE